MTTAEPSERQLRNMREQITEARTSLAVARLDGGYKQIRFWLDRTNLLLERLHQVTHVPESR